MLHTMKVNYHLIVLLNKYKDNPKNFISNLREAADYTPVSKENGRLQKIDFITHG